MQIILDQIQAAVPVTVMRLQGELDASNYDKVIAQARTILAGNVNHILVDMDELSFMSSSGIVALHTMVTLMRGEKPPDPDSGWEAFHAIDRDRESGPQAHVKLLNPQPKILNSLQITGLDRYFEIFTDREEALASF